MGEGLREEEGGGGKEGNGTFSTRRFLVHQSGGHRATTLSSIKWLRLSTRPAARPLMTETRRRVVGTSRDASRALASALAMAAPAPASASLVRVDALDRVFDIIDANRDGSLTVQEFILVRPPASPRRRAKNARSVPSFSSPGVGDPRVRGARGGHSAS